MRLHLLSCGTSLLLAASTFAAHATTIDNFTFTSGTDTLTFSLPEPATPSSYQSAYTSFNAPITFDGIAVTPGSSQESFGVITQSGQLVVSFIILGNKSITSIFETGPQVFTGPTSAPVFGGTTYFTVGGEALNGTFITPPPPGGTLTVVKTLSSTATPEPSSFVLLGTGLLGAFGVVRRRLCR